MWSDLVVRTTGLGDLAVVIPGSLLVFVVLWASGARRAAYGWGLTIGVCAVTLLAAKFFCLACYPALLTPSLRSPSGHAGLSAGFYGALAVLALTVRPRWVALAVSSLCVAIVAAIAASRIALGAHSVVEVAAGLAIGVGVVLALRPLRRAPAPRLRTLALALGAVVVAAVVFDGHRVMAEPAIWRFAGWLTGSPICWR